MIASDTLISGENPTKLSDFAREVEAWHSQTIFHSRTDLIIENEHFRNVQNMLRSDWNCVTEAIEMLRKEPSHLVWAFNTIFGVASEITPSRSGSYFSLGAACDAFVEAYDNGVLRKMWDLINKAAKEELQ